MKITVVQRRFYKEVLITIGGTTVTVAVWSDDEATKLAAEFERVARLIRE